MYVSFKNFFEIQCFQTYLLLLQQPWWKNCMSRFIVFQERIPIRLEVVGRYIGINNQ